MNEIRPLAVFIKALFLFALANFAFTYFNPPIGKISIYNWLVPGRERVPYDREIENYNISHTIPVYEDMDAMYQSTTLSQPKQADEFRIFLLGDSSAWGFELRPEETLVGQLNALELYTCEGKRIVVYNAAFPLPYVMKDLIIMDKVREYQPDMFLWTITLEGFRNRTVYTNFFLDPYSTRVTELVNEYQLNNLDTEKMREQTFWQKTIIGQRSRLKKIFLLQIHGFGWSATKLDYTYQNYQPLSQDQLNDNTFFEIPQGEFDLKDQLLFDVLEAGYQLAGETPVLVVNEPIFIATGENSDVRYNTYYPHWTYDEYLIYLDEQMQRNHRNYINTWNFLPSSEFTDSPFHRTPKGEKMFAELLAQHIQNLSCTK